ncbi:MULTISPECIES: sigma factor G inhibitor Gin [Clostridium]|uniref:Sigma factor G inhibitor Gin n=1 Tax=Clostridium aquiflavi TaxID=3073603 RepID=A0ABU1EJI6_9CLOT|nr:MULTISPECIES: sigma factor G inhibitor Gin [unclassified Clostridium]MDR5588546.1 sigma factor G inhibitor Gin [Clostridium sp. 5N-1]NFG61895.1 CsfB protein [Clostridium botulinum]NFQ10858.1 CsfB protein [Clostridium botulinum]
MENKVCFLCGKKEGSGIILKGEKICSNCECELTNISVVNPKYHYFKEKVKNILFKK